MFNRKFINYRWGNTNPWPSRSHALCHSTLTNIGVRSVATGSLHRLNPSSIRRKCAFKLQVLMLHPQNPSSHTQVRPPTMTLLFFIQLLHPLNGLMLGLPYKIYFDPTIYQVFLQRWVFSLDDYFVVCKFHLIDKKEVTHNKSVANSHDRYRGPQIC